MQLGSNIRASPSITDGHTHYEVSFIYGRGGGRPFTASIVIMVKPLSPEFYGVAVRVQPLSP